MNPKSQSLNFTAGTSRKKKHSIEERIAGMLVRGSFRDIRDGFGGSVPPDLTAQDLAAALGMVATTHGRVSCEVLETHYGSTLMHLESLLRAWEEREHASGRTRDEVVLSRFSGELAIRELASIHYGTPQLAHYAYLIFSRRERLQARMQDASGWLHDIRDQALIELRQNVKLVRNGERRQLVS